MSNPTPKPNPQPYKVSLQDVVCPRCDGDGEEPGAPVSPIEIAVCSLCDGEGTVTAEAAAKYAAEEAEEQ